MAATVVAAGDGAPPTAGSPPYYFVDLWRYASGWSDVNAQIMFDAADELSSEARGKKVTLAVEEKKPVQLPAQVVVKRKRSKSETARRPSMPLSPAEPVQQSTEAGATAAAAGTGYEGVKAIKKNTKDEPAPATAPAAPPSSHLADLPALPGTQGRGAPARPQPPQPPSAAPPAPPEPATQEAEDGDGTGEGPHPPTECVFEEFSTGETVRISCADPQRGLVVTVGGWEVTVGRGETLRYLGSLILLGNGGKLSVPAHNRTAVLRSLRRMCAAAGVQLQESVSQITPVAGGEVEALSKEDLLDKQKAYIKRHRVHLLLGDALDSCLRDLPLDPYYYIASTLMRYSSSRYGTGNVGGTAGGLPPAAIAAPGDPHRVLENRATTLECEVRRLQQHIHHIETEHALEKEVLSLREQVTRMVWG